MTFLRRPSLRLPRIIYTACASALALPLLIATALPAGAATARNAAPKPVVTTTTEVLTPVADAYVASTSPKGNFGRAIRLRVASFPTSITYLRFDLRRLRGKLLVARLELDSAFPSGGRFDIRVARTRHWRESAITFGSAPAFDRDGIRFSGPQNARSVRLDITRLVRRGGIVSIALASTRPGARFVFGSRESGVGRPRLLVMTSGKDIPPGQAKRRPPPEPDTFIDSLVDHDSTAPVDEDGDGNERVRLTYHLTDATQAEYSLDSGAYVQAPASPALIQVSVGAHTFRLRALGDATPATASITIAGTAAPAPATPPPAPLLPPPPPPSGSSQFSLPRLGISITEHDLINRSATDRQLLYNEIQAIGGKFVRVGYWTAGEPYIDALVAEMKKRGIRVLLTVPASSRSWANAGTTTATADTCRSKAAKYGPMGVDSFEFLNEPDLNGWTPENYTTYLKACYRGIKEGNPNAKLSTGGIWKWDCSSCPYAGKGTAAGTLEWVKRMYAAGARGHFDALALHLYDDPFLSGDWNVWDWAFKKSVNVRSFMNSQGDSSIPIWSSENGGPSTKYGEAGQATITTNQIKALSMYPVQAVTYYTIFDDIHAGFGLLRLNRTRKPAWYAYQQAALAQ